MAYPLPTTITAGDTGHITHTIQQHKRHNFEGPKVKADFGAVGDANHNTGGGTDDTTAFQDAINAAHDQNVGCVLVEPGSYRVGTLKMFKSDGSGGRIALVGLGARNGAGTHGPALVYDGAISGANGYMLDYDTTGTHIGGSPIINLGLHMRNTAGATAVRYRKRVDLGSFLDGVWFGRSNGSAVLYDQGSTNGFIYRSRWDGCKGINIDFQFGVTSIFGVYDCTSDNTLAGGETGDPAGFFKATRDGLDQNDRLYVHFQNINLECQQSLAEVEAGGANPADRRGQYQFVTTAAHTTLQYVVSFANLKHDTNSSLASYSVFLARGDGTAAQRGRRISIVGKNLSGVGGPGTNATNDKIPLGNVAAAMQPANPGGPYAVFEHKPQNTEIFGNNRPITHQYVGTD